MVCHYGWRQLETHWHWRLRPIFFGAAYFFAYFLDACVPYDFSGSAPIRANTRWIESLRTLYRTHRCRRRYCDHDYCCGMSNVWTWRHVINLSALSCRCCWWPFRFRIASSLLRSTGSPTLWWCWYFHCASCRTPTVSSPSIGRQPRRFEFQCDVFASESIRVKRMGTKKEIKKISHIWYQKKRSLLQFKSGC